MGFFVNTVALRVKVATSSGPPTLTELVHNTHDSVLDALEHSDCPFSCVVDALKIARDPSRSPIFQVHYRSVLSVLVSGLQGWGAFRFTDQSGEHAR